MSTRVKICGLTSLEDAMAAVAAGADALGFVLADSPRQLRPDQVRHIVAQLPPLVVTVGVFVNAAVAEVQNVRDFCGLDMVQLHGPANQAADRLLGGPRRVIRVVSVGLDQAPDPAAHPEAAMLLDAKVQGLAGGTGKTFDWPLALAVAQSRPIILAGGLNPDNVRLAIQTVKPFAVDVSSGVEAQPGRKDHAKLARFIQNARAAL
ncbi:N-(5'phosphoribosyl)anthranilate isomerase (PRAI) [Desulfarculus baarsii DSM 2075]|uniref:N-(5'-phosphoribosyl)anthranilate isomerase n=1 Tax=Desulfarculus baarsii (strain ATCC 33931 / DSM 2075 / LMG 7858 / VKM B-1802 / 2st14) TaxID=644282 RepID=E1QEM0_DESB2|nr:phosphoribosylanthranilate isomerase [Desulfarculus baarsii]ADK84006.1 N-(5'phosphoribosyl)anthranilate isomerase (PRAI) [Desulfarculus baarsii DSM 2075]